MKKIFTLIAGLLLASGSVFAQDYDWKNIVTNGDMEGEQDPEWSSFWCHDWRAEMEGEDNLPGGQVRDASGQFQGYAEIVVDPSDPNNHCARVVIRSDAEAQEAGNRVENNGNLASWDCQFFIYGTEEIPEGKLIRVTLRVKGEKAGSFETQAHQEPGNYGHYQLFGNKDYTTEWQTITLGPTKVTANHVTGDGNDHFQTVAFNLSTKTDGNIIYIDDVVMEIADPEPPKELEGWYNLIKSGGVVGEEIFKFTYDLARIHGHSEPYFTVSGYQNDGNGTVPCPIVNDPIDGQPAYSLTTTVATEWADTTINIDGNNKSPVPYFLRKVQEGEDSLEILKGYTTQLFIGTNHIFTEGEKYHFSMKMRATQETSASAQIHYSPGDYKHWQMLEGSIKPNEEWQTYEYEGEITSDQNGGTTIAFNLNEWNFDAPENDVPITYYFRDIEFSCNSAEVKDPDIILADENVIWQTPAKGGDADPGLDMKVDLTNALTALGVESVEKLMDGTIKAIFANEKGNESFVESGSDYYIDGKGYYTEDVAINISYDEDKTEGNEVTFTIYNTGVDVDAASVIPTKILFTVTESSAPADFKKRTWGYLLNVSLYGSEEAYQQALGVEDLKPAAKTAGAIFDLSGRRVAAPAKGLYIQDGKKIIFK
jgi:hypothetical protein